MSHVCGRYFWKTCPVSSIFHFQTVSLSLWAVFGGRSLCFHLWIVSLIARQCVHAWIPTGWWGVAWESCSPPRGCFVQHLPAPVVTQRGAHLCCTARGAQNSAFLVLVTFLSRCNSFKCDVLFLCCFSFPFCKILRQKLGELSHWQLDGHSFKNDQATCAQCAW